MNTTKKFLQLTSKTYPHGTEKGLEHLLPKGLSLDGFGNYYLEIGENYTTMFTSHLDTACGSSKIGEEQKVQHRFSKDGKMVGTDGKTILGADCKAGVVIMMNMIEKKVPGLYYFFLGEEVGCQGSKWLAREMFEGRMFPNHTISKIISFDRKSTKSIITYQWAGRCASDAFADGLIKEFKETGMTMEKDPTGVCTDSIQFQDFIPECTNISVGYYSEHSGSERQDLEFLSQISEAVTKIDWESLPVERDPSVTDYGNFWEEWEEEERYMSGSAYRNTGSNKTWSKDYTTFIKDPYTGEPTEVYLSLERIYFEKQIISGILSSWFNNEEDFEASELDWNGRHLSISFDGENMDSLSRNDLTHSDSRLSRIEGDDIKLMEEEEGEEYVIGGI